jgi:hypothetical protein
MELIKMFGIADCHGVESFIPYNESRDTANLLFALDLRASANRQRHAVVYIADLSSEAITKIDARLNNCNSNGFKSALNIIKAEAARILFYEHGHVKDLATASQYAKSWKMIPNDKLDPYF